MQSASRPEGRAYQGKIRFRFRHTGGTHGIALVLGTESGPDTTHAKTQSFQG